MPPPFPANSGAAFEAGAHAWIPLPFAENSVAAFEPVPHVWPELPEQPSSAPLIIERIDERNLSLGRVSEPIVLDDVREYAFEPRGRPIAGEIELGAVDAELGFHQLAVECRHFR